MKNKKTVLVGFASLLLFGVVAVALTTNKTINFNSMSHGELENHYMDIEASQLEQAMNGDGTFALGSYDTWKAENVEFFTEGGLRYAKVGPSASIYSTSTAGSEVANDYRGAGYTSLTFYNKKATTTSTVYLLDNSGVEIGGVSGSATIDDSDAASQNVLLPQSTAKRLKIGGVTGEGNYLAFTKVRLSYTCEEVEPIRLDVDLGVAGDIISGEGWDDVVAKFFNGDKSRQQYVLPVYNGFMARFEVPDWAVTVNFIRIPGKTSGEGQPDVITDEWVNSHFWGGNASNTLVPGVQTAKLNKTTYLLENLPTNIVLDINVSGFITGGERVGFYFYNKANSDNVWVQGTIESSTVTVVVPQGYTHFQVLRTELSDSPLSWSCPNWGQINEVALIPESNELLVTGELVSMNASWVYADRYITLDFTGSDIIHDGWGDGVVIYMIGGDRDDFAELTMESLYVAKIKVIPNTTSIKIIRIPLADKPNPVTWEWINDSHFWGGNVEISLPADAVSGTVGSDYTVTWD